MTVAEAQAILHEYNRWRRGADIPQPHPTNVGKAIDLACRELKKAMSNV